MKATVTTISSNPCCLQQPHDVLHHRLVDERHHRLGSVRGERAQAGALAPGHDHGLHGGGTPASPHAASPRLAQGPPRHRHVERRGVPGQHEAGDAGEPGERPGRVGPADGALGGEEEREGDHEEKVQAFPNQVTSIRRAPSAARAGWRRRPGPPGRAPPRANQVGTEPSMRMPPDADEEQEPVGDRVEELAELGHLVEVPGDVAVEEVGDAEHGQQTRPPWPGPPARRGATGTPAAWRSRTTVMTFGTVRIRSVC